MVRAQSPAEASLKDVVAQAVTAPLKTAGFRKTGMNYHRRHGQTVQVINVQVSHGSSWMEKKFFVNVGIAFDAVCQLSQVAILERPKEYECDDRGTRDRLGQLIPDIPDSLVVRAGKEVNGILTVLNRAVERLRVELDHIDGLEAYRSHRWFDRFRPTATNAQVLYLLGDPDGAWQEVQDLASLFADRQNANSPKWWIEQLRLVGLENRSE